MNITGSILKSIVPNITSERAESIADKLNTICKSYGIIDVSVMRCFIATIAHESGGFRLKEENLNYTKASGLMKTWPKHFKDENFAAQYVRNPKKLGEYIYGSTSIAKTLGNTSKEDGYELRGSGFIQLTGRNIATQYAKYVGIATAEEAMKLVRTDDWWAIDSACWCFMIFKNVKAAAMKEDIMAVTRKINGGEIGKESRLKYFELCKKYIK